MFRNILLRISIGVITIVLGWLSLGIGFSIKTPYNGLIFYSGFAFIIFGILVLTIKKNKKKQTGNNTDSTTKTT